MAEVDASSSPVTALFQAILLNVVLIAAAVFGARAMARRPAAELFGRCIFLLALVTPIDHLDTLIRAEATRWMPQEVYLGVITAVLLIPLTAAGWLVLGRPRMYGWVRRGVLIMAPVGVGLALNAGWAMARSRPDAARSAGPVERPRPERLVWVVFDELDYELAFPLRPRSIEMPALDALRKESFFATQASSPAANTMESMASYLTGRRVAEFRGEGPRYPARLAGGEVIELAGQATFLSRARESGFDTYLAGWHLPYCRMFGRDLSECHQVSVVSIRPKDLWSAWTGQWARMLSEGWIATRFTRAGQGRIPWFGWELRADHALGYEFMRQASLSLATRPGGGLLFLHFPIPHPLGIFDRRSNEIAVRDGLNSIDNLELVDRTVGELRAAMEREGTWNGTTVIVTSDHPLRDTWAANATWSDEERVLRAARKKELVPFLVKPAGSTAALEWSRPMNTIVAPALVQAMLTGTVRTVEDVAAFIEKDSGLQENR